MKKMATLFVAFYGGLFINCQPQTSMQTLSYEKIIYRSGRCNGTCPKIDMVIDKDGKIWVQREFYISKSEVDFSKSGRFEGVLNRNEMNDLKKLLKESSYSNINMPDINIVDLSMLTLIIYDNKKRNWFRFIKPPEEMKALVSFLHRLVEEKKLEKTAKQQELEE